VIVVGAVVIAVSFVLGVVAFVALAAAVLVMAAIIGVRAWWLSRKLGARPKSAVHEKRGRDTNSEIIEGEYLIVEVDKKQKRSD